MVTTHTKVKKKNVLDALGYRMRTPTLGSMSNGYKVFLRQFGAAVRSRREALQLTQPLLADRTSLIDQASLSRLERGMQGFSSESLYQLAEALEVHVCHLFGGVLSDAQSHLSPEGITVGQTWDDMTPDQRKLFHAAMTLANANLSKNQVKATATQQTLLPLPRGTVNNNTKNKRRTEEEAKSIMKALTDEYGSKQVAQSRRDLEGAIEQQTGIPKRHKKARAPR